MTTQQLSLVSPAIERLQSRVQGRVFVPGATGYDAARQAWNLTVDQRPALIVAAARAADIAEAVRFAREAGLGVAVQATGHGLVRPADGGLLILTGQMTGVEIDPGFQTARIEAGARWGVVLEAAQAHGLAPLLGSSPDVGAVGYTLGGGIGWLARKYGLAADSVLSFDVVTAAGDLIRASEDEHADLFWGLRGGGSGLGIVAAMEVRLYPVTTVYGGNLVYPAGMARDVFLRYRAWIASAPDELTSSIVLMNFPPIPQVPEFLRGQSAVIVRGCYAGPVEQGAALVDEWRAWRTPMLDAFGEMPFSQVAAISNDPEGPTKGLSTSVWLRELSDEAIDTLIQYGVGSGLTVIEVRHVGGRIAQASPDLNAYSNREDALVLQLIGMTPTPEAWTALEDYAGRFKQALRPVLTGRVYLNFLDGEEKRARTQDAYTPEAFRRLTALKARYDPENRFAYGLAIPPAK